MILAGVAASSPGRCAVASRGLTRRRQPRGGSYEEDGEVQSAQVIAQVCKRICKRDAAELAGPRETRQVWRDTQPTYAEVDQTDRDPPERLSRASHCS
jgi:hypothetical protein